MQTIDRPAIVSASTAELDRLAHQATTALEAARKSTKTTLERWKDAGEALIKAKASCKHGEWLPWLEKHKIHRREASRAMRVAGNWAKLDKLSNLDAALRLLAKKGDEEEIPDPSTVAPTIFCRPCRIYGPTAGCKACEQMRNPPEREPGDDTEVERQAEDRNPTVKKIDRHAERLVKIAQEVLKRDIDKKDAERLQADLQQALERLRRCALAPVKAGSPQRGSCKKCKMGLLWLVSEYGRKFPLDDEPHPQGEFAIEGGVAVFVRPGEANGRELYRAHRRTCRRR
jgi:hypothetical protein